MEKEKAAEGSSTEVNDNIHITSVHDDTADEEDDDGVHVVIDDKDIHVHLLDESDSESVASSDEDEHIVENESDNDLDFPDVSINIADAQCDTGDCEHTCNTSSGDNAAVFDETSDLSNCRSVMGFKLVGDNIDKIVRPSYERINSFSLSFHYFHYYAILNRVDLSGLSDMKPLGVYDMSKILPSSKDVNKLKNNFSILISRYV